MKSKMHLAIDIGASSGRHILGWQKDGMLHLEEVHRFPNSMTQTDGCLCWDVDALFDEIITGMKKCAVLGKIPVSVGIDTWGADYVLLDKNGNRIGPAFAYRDSRTEDTYSEVFKCMPEDELYARTGIHKLVFNTINQLMAAKIKTPHLLENARHLLMIPDYLHYKLCGAMKTEYTDASTGGLLNALTKNWDDEIIARCGFPREIFCELVPAGTVLGELTDDIKRVVGYGCTVVMPPSHDTASAFLAVPAKSENSIYISSGTWSLMGVELSSPITTDAARIAHFTNEGGYDFRIRFLKNIMGLWILQSVQREIAQGISFAEIADLARASQYDGLIDANDERFFAPQSMTKTITDACRENGHAEPQGLGDIARCIYRSLAASYAHTVKQLESLTGKRYDYINIIGGGSANMYLNELTAAACGMPVLAGPSEGTALGNIVSQMIAYEDLPDIATAREAIRRSFDIREILP